MSKKKDKDCCTCKCCCCNSCGYNNYNAGANWDNGLLEAVVFWLIACGAGLLNTNSMLIILLFILYGWSCDGGSGIFY